MGRRWNLRRRLRQQRLNSLNSLKSLNSTISLTSPPISTHPDHLFDLHSPDCTGAVAGSNPACLAPRAGWVCQKNTPRGEQLLVEGPVRPIPRSPSSTGVSWSSLTRWGGRWPPAPTESDILLPWKYSNRVVVDWPTPCISRYT